MAAGTRRDASEPRCGPASARNGVLAVSPSNLAAVSNVTSPVVGTVWKIQRAEGDSVSQGDEIMILESMKMEIPVEAESTGTIASISVAEGDHVVEGQVLATLE